MKNKYIGAQLGRPRYYLGTIVGGATYLFAELGCFGSAAAARAKAAASPRSGVVLVFAERDVVTRGIAWGIDMQLVGSAA